MHKLPVKRMSSADALDVDDFNELISITAEESGRVDETNFVKTSFGIGDANRILWYERDMGMASASEFVDNTAAGQDLLGRAGWRVVAEETVECRTAKLRCSGRIVFSDYDVEGKAAIRVDGVLDYDSIVEAGQTSTRSTIATIEVAGGTHLVEFVFYPTASYGGKTIDRAGLDIQVRER